MFIFPETDHRFTIYFTIYHDRDKTHNDCVGNVNANDSLGDVG